LVTNGSTATYGYDAWGRRVRKTVDGVTTGYLHDGDDLVLEMDGSGSPVREYAYYPGVDNPHSMRYGGQTYYYATELPGHVAGLVSSSNQVVNEYRYTPFGELLGGFEQVPQPLGFTAREQDRESGLVFMRARYYDPQTGRFISEDLIGLAGGINPYAYVDNDPINFTDPFGLAAEAGRGTNDCTALLQAAGVTAETAKAMCAAGTLATLTVTAQRGDPFAFMNQMMARADATMNKLMASGYLTGGDAMAFGLTMGTYRLVAQETRTATAQWLKQTGIPGKESNTPRHLYGSCYLARTYGPEIATAVTNAHEIYLFPWNQRKNAADSQEDRRNNALGIALGARGANCALVGLIGR
jgi:RHS repeat-associated protein